MSIYLERYAYPSLKIEQPPDNQTGLIVVLPSFNEPNLVQALQSLHACELPKTLVEVIVVINEAEDSPQQITDQNNISYHNATEWLKQNKIDGISFYITKTKLPAKHAGVGLARKAGMDEAVRRFEHISNKKGIILCYDADCTCEPHYLKEVYNTFKKENLLGASVYYEHDSNDLTPSQYNGIIQYELHLRYYVNGLRKAGYPFAFHTVGSSMAVRSDIYQKAGGMNKRKAGEDFHFLHKIIPYGNFAEINTTSVYPSSRVSTRVPFGTGKAMQTWLNEGMVEIVSYHPEIFDHLKILLKAVPTHYNIKSFDTIKQNLPSLVSSYLEKQRYKNELDRIVSNSPNVSRFIENWFQWFNGLKALHFVHYLRDNGYPSISVSKAAAQLNNIQTNNPVKLLEFYRKKDKEFKVVKVDLKHLYSGFQ